MPTHHDPFESLVADTEISISLDGTPVKVPSARKSLNSIRSYLEALALEKQRVLGSLNVDGRIANLTLPLPTRQKFSRVTAESVALDESPLLILKTAWEQAEHNRECAETALTLVLINDHDVACELWWNLACQLKEPILTLSFLPDQICGVAKGGASLKQLRKWQLEQVAAIIREVDQACLTGTTIQISDALENRVLPWLIKLNDLIQLWHDTELARTQIETKNKAF